MKVVYSYCLALFSTLIELAALLMLFCISLLDDIQVLELSCSNRLGAGGEGRPGSTGSIFERAA